MSWPPVLSQRTYPGHDPVPGDGKPDYDDCWIVATIWAATASRPGLRKPGIPEFRRHAGEPDTAGVDGGSLDDIVKGVKGQWPDLACTRFVGAWSGFSSSVRGGKPASLAVWSGDLPPALRYGFNGAHQIGVAWDDGWLVMNPLAQDGDPLRPISETDLSRAALSRSLPYGGLVRAVLFPARLPDTGTEDTVIYSLPEADGPYPAIAPKGTPVFSSATDKTGSPLPADRVVMVVAAGTAKDTAKTGRRAVHGNYSGKVVNLGWIDVTRLVR